MKEIKEIKEVGGAARQRRAVFFEVEEREGRNGARRCDGNVRGAFLTHVAQRATEGAEKESVN